MIDETLSSLRQRAQYCAYSALLGIEIEELGPGYARVAATVRPEHFNFLGRLHGGFLMSLADQAFALASNTVPGDYVAVQFNINLLGSLQVGQRVFSQGRIIHQGRTLGVVEMKVEDAGGRVLATATGTVIATARPSQA